MSISQQTLEAELQALPEPLLDEILDFVRFLKTKTRAAEARSAALASEATLAKDWLRPEEDEAWKTL